MSRNWKVFWNAHPAIKPMIAIVLFLGFMVGIVFDSCIVEPQANNACAALTREGGV